MKPTLLIVDDSPIILSMLKSILAEDYVIKEAIDGKTAIKIAGIFIPDLILLDVVMSDMDGYEVCKKLKNNFETSHIPIIFVTVLNSIIDESYGFKVGGSDFITKPFNSSILKARIKTHIAISDKNFRLQELVKEKTIELENLNMNLVESLVIVSEYKDIETTRHACNVSSYASLLAEKLGFNNRQIELVVIAAKLHDIGKIGIPDVILQKPGIYTPEERLAMQHHTNIGREIMRSFEGEFFHTARVCAEQHHERWNGTGYPNGLKGEKINIVARIMAIADVFDALVCNRSYKRTWGFEEAFLFISTNKDMQFDPFILTKFIEYKDDIYTIYKGIKEKASLEIS